MILAVSPRQAAGVADLAAAAGVGGRVLKPSGAVAAGEVLSCACRQQQQPDPAYPHNTAAPPPPCPPDAAACQQQQHQQQQYQAKQQHRHYGYRRGPHGGHPQLRFRQGQAQGGSGPVRGDHNQQFRVSGGAVMSGASGDARGGKPGGVGGPGHHGNYPDAARTQGQGQFRQGHRYNHRASSSGSNPGGPGGAAASPANAPAASGTSAHQGGGGQEDGPRRFHNTNRRGSWKANSRSREARGSNSPRGPFSPSPLLSRAVAAAAGAGGAAEVAVGTGGGRGSKGRGASPSVKPVGCPNASTDKGESADDAGKRIFDAEAAEAHLQQTWDKICAQLDCPDVPDHWRPVLYRNPRNAWKPVRPMSSADFVKKVLASAGCGKRGN